MPTLSNTIKEKNTKKSSELFKKAVNLIPGGVNSPVRSLKDIGREPLFILKAQGPYIWDVDNNKYIDYVGSWGALIHGHAHPEIINAVENALLKGTSYGACHENEIKLAEIITSYIPSIEKVRLVNSGTEAVMTAIRLARAFTDRDKIIKFAGSYHGHSDSVLTTSCSSTITTLGIPSTKGVTKKSASDTITLPYNDFSSIEITFAKFPHEIAAVIVEPIVGNCGVIKPKDNFLQHIRDLTKKYKSVLIFDEVITGFRSSRGGAQGKYNIVPCLTTLGKIIGGGMPIGAVGGKKEIMDWLAPEGPVYQAGTLSGNPISVACGIATLNLLEDKETYKYLENLTNILCEGIQKINQEEEFKAIVNSDSSMFSIFFTDGNVFDHTSAKKSNTKIFSKFFNSMLSQGIYLAPSQFEANFISTAHSEEDIKQTLEAYKHTVQFIKEQN